MSGYLRIAPVLLLLSACGGTPALLEADLNASAERFFRGVYGCDAAVVDELASEDIVVSYPIFEQLFNTPSLRGRAAVKKFATGFCSRWEEAQITIHEAVSEGARVVLVWSFLARNAETGQQSSWGGITLFRFDETGRIVAEVGEESEPGPAKRLQAGEHGQ